MANDGRKGQEWLDELDKLVKQHGTDQQQQRSNELATEVEEIIAEKQSNDYRGGRKQVEDLYYRVRFAIPAYWVNQFQWLEGESEMFTNKEDADRLIRHGSKLSPAEQH